MKLGLWTVLLGVSVAAVPACSAGPSNDSGGTNPSGEARGSDGTQETGSIGLQLMLPSGQSIEVIGWAITGPNGASTVVQSGTANSQSLGVSFLVGNIPAGSGYQIALSGTATDGSVTCTGSASFSVSARVSTPVTVQLACAVATGGAHVTRVNGSSYNCAALSNVSASPTETTLGNSIMVSAAAVGPVTGNLAYAWSAPSGTFGSSTGATTSFQCAVAGPVTLTVVASDGPVPAGDSCTTALSTKTVNVTCDPVQVPPPPVPATPPWGLVAMAAAMAGIGAAVGQRKGVRRAG